MQLIKQKMKKSVEHHNRFWNKISNYVTCKKPALNGNHKKTEMNK